MQTWLHSRAWLRSVGLTLLTGFTVGGLAWGGPVSLLHLLHNQLVSPRDGLAALAFMVVLYGGWVAGSYGMGWLLAAAWLLLRQRGRADADRVRALGGGLGLLVFNLFFWELYFLYGLTYEQTLLFHPQRFAGMAAYLGAAALLIALAVLLLVYVLHRSLEALQRRGAQAAAALGSAVVLVLAHGAIPLAGRATTPTRERTEPRSAEPPEIEPSPRSFKVMLLGLDGADPGVLHRLRAEGQLPNFDRLVAAGAFGELATLPDSNSPVIWASLYTGSRPEVHRVLDFYQVRLPGVRAGLYPVHRTYFKELIDLLAPSGLVRRTSVSRGDVGAPLLWEIADGAGLSAGVVDGYLYSFPAHAPSGDGFFLAYGLDGYARLLERGELDVGDVRLFVLPKEAFPLVEPVLDQPDFFWQSEALLRLLEHHGQPRFLSLYTHEPDTVQHQYWKWFEPERFAGVDAEELARFRDRIPSLYRAFDRFLGELLARLDPSTALVVVSDHGHVATIAHEYYTQHRHGPPGIVLLYGPPFKAGYTLEGSHVFDVYPTLLHLLGLPVPEDAAGRVLVEALAEGFVKLAPVRTFPTYQGRFGTSGPNQRRSLPLDQEEIEKLKQLGYL